MDSNSRTEGSQGDDGKSNKLERVNTSTGRSERDDKKCLVAIRREGATAGRDALSIGYMRQHGIIGYGTNAQICLNYSPVVTFYIQILYALQLFGGLLVQ
jgi:hypothetical protein